MAATQARAKDKDPKALSGGEKSFSTICLLLALWESIGCPIRCLGTFSARRTCLAAPAIVFCRGLSMLITFLDEFDVFMDAVNRRISMKMMVSPRRYTVFHQLRFLTLGVPFFQIDTAKASDGKQYILITPQDMQNVSITDAVRVHRMSDPERNQGVLQFT